MNDFTAITPADPVILAAHNRMMDAARARRVALDAHLVTKPQSIPCPAHRDVTRHLDMKLSERASFNAGSPVAEYSPCGLCEQSKARSEQDARLQSQGVPSVLLHCDFENWTPGDESERAHLETVRHFAYGKRGFVVMLGRVGTGKSHLAIAAMREFRSGLFVKQGELLRRLRLTYRDRQAEDPVERCQRAGLLVLDEMGVSVGGKDESPMLHEVLDYRHGEHRPTILTSNLDWQAFRETIGERLADRLRESAHVLTFNGKSHRPERRENYFNPEQQTRLPYSDQ